MRASPLVVLQMQATLQYDPTEFDMKRLLISGFVAVALLAITTTIRTYSISREHYAVTTGAVTWKKPSSLARPAGLPIEEYEDMSLVFTTPVKH
jgi:hypothetical protein